MKSTKIIKEKNRIKKIAQDRRNSEINKMREDATYRTYLAEQMKMIDKLLTDSEVESIIINVDESMLSNFLKAIYLPEMTSYSVVQIDSNKFSISRKLILV